MYRTSRRFLDSASASPRPGSITILGAGFDSTTSSRPGARFGPTAIRDASEGLESYSPSLRRDLNDRDIIDLGDLELGFGSPERAVQTTRTAVSNILAAEATPLMLGGEHSLSVGSILACAQHYPNLGVIQLDAHADLRHEYLGESLSHACAMRRVLDGLSDAQALLQVGIRSGTRDEFLELERSKRLIEPTPAALERALEDWNRPLYLTLDLDILDPSVVPGTGTPEPGGLSWRELESLFEVLRHHRIVGADVMELAPMLDSSGCSAIVAAKAVRELLLLLTTSAHD